MIIWPFRVYSPHEHTLVVSDEIGESWERFPAYDRVGYNKVVSKWKTSICIECGQRFQYELISEETVFEPKGL